MALDERRIESSRVPYVPIVVVMSRDASEFRFEAVVDTGYTGFVVVPRGSFSGGTAYQLRLQLADGSQLLAPVFQGSVRIGDTVLDDIAVTELGDEAIIGMRVIDYFTLTIDHGRT